jgi:hypothetical protein
VSLATSSASDDVVLRETWVSSLRSIVLPSIWDVDLSVVVLIVVPPPQVFCAESPSKQRTPAVAVVQLD